MLLSKHFCVFYLTLPTREYIIKATKLYEALRMKNVKARLDILSIPDVLCPFGEKITTAEQFDAHRAKILDMLEAEEYGRMPDAPEKNVG